MAEYGKRLSGVGALFACLFLLLLAAPAADAAGFGVGSFTTTASTSQAGAHADLDDHVLPAHRSARQPDRLDEGRAYRTAGGRDRQPGSCRRCSFRSLETAACLPASQIGSFTLSFVACRGYTTPLIGTAEVGDTEIEMESTEGVCEEEANDNNLITIGSGPGAGQVRIRSLLTSHTVELVERSSTNMR